MCVSSQAWLRLEQNNYLLDTDESSDTQSHTHYSVLFFPAVHLSFSSLLPKCWQFTLQHIFHNLWQLAIKLADRKQTVNFHKITQNQMPVHTLTHNTGTHTHTHTHTHTQIEVRSQHFANRLSDHYKLYWLCCFYSELNRVTTTRNQPELVIGYWNLCT